MQLLESRNFLRLLIDRKLKLGGTGKMCRFLFQFLGCCLQLVQQFRFRRLFQISPRVDFIDLLLDHHFGDGRGNLCPERW